MALVGAITLGVFDWVYRLGAAVDLCLASGTD